MLARCYVAVVLATLALSFGALSGQAAAAATYSLAVSAQPDRSGAVPLAGRTYARPAKIHIFVTPTTEANSVRFYLDTPTTLYRTDGAAPFDFAGTANDGSAIALDVSTLPAGLHTITAAIETASGETRVSAVFTITAPVAVPSLFPSRLKASGRSIVDENGYVLPTLRGFNMHVDPTFKWDQSHFEVIKTLGGKINRAVLHWDQFEPSQGVIDSAAIANLDVHIARARTAGMYTLLDLHLNIGRVPAWTWPKFGEMEKYAAYGQKLTQYLAYRYGNPASPQYTKAVVGFGLNEPPVEDSAIRNGNGAVPYLEAKQRQMISWMRAPGYAASWIGFVSYAYAAATPIYDDTKQNPNAADASPTAYDSVGANVVIDVHDYMAYCTNHDPGCEGRNWNGTINPTYQGGPLMQTSEVWSYTSSAVRQSQHAAHLKPYKTFSTQANIPLMVGEWGWRAGPTGESGWMADKRMAWRNAGTVIEIQWIYDISATNSEWAARPAGIWRPSTWTLFAAGT